MRRTAGFVSPTILLGESCRVPANYLLLIFMRCAITVTQAPRFGSSEPADVVKIKFCNQNLFLFVSNRYEWTLTLAVPLSHAAIIGSRITIVQRVGIIHHRYTD